MTMIVIEAWYPVKVAPLVGQKYLEKYLRESRSVRQGPSLWAAISYTMRCAP